MSGYPRDRTSADCGNNDSSRIRRVAIADVHWDSSFKRMSCTTALQFWTNSCVFRKPVKFNASKSISAVRSSIGSCPVRNLDQRRSCSEAVGTSGSDCRRYQRKSQVSPAPCCFGSMVNFTDTARRSCAFGAFVGPNEYLDNGIVPSSLVRSAQIRYSKIGLCPICPVIGKDHHVTVRNGSA